VRITGPVTPASNFLQLNSYIAAALRASRVDQYKGETKLSARRKCTPRPKQNFRDDSGWTNALFAYAVPHPELPSCSAS
jgi:hypothetical protein